MVNLMLPNGEFEMEDLRFQFYMACHIKTTGEIFY